MNGDKSLESGLMRPRPLLFLILWYFFSFTTILLNKHILSTLDGDPVLLATTQMAVTCLLGSVQMYYPLGMALESESAKGVVLTKPKGFWKNMFIVGSMRFSTVLLGLVALEYVAVSFTETVKSSAPIFTVLIARLVIGETTSLIVNLSLIPIMGGLALASMTELSFHILGFSAALGTNLSECLQNVISKLLISHSTYKYSPAELQCFTALASMLVQLPVSAFLMDFSRIQRTFSTDMLIALLINGVSFHLQTMTAYVLMAFISPVTHSVANTVKRAFIIWLSILVFGNRVTAGSGIGTMIVICGVFVYNKAQGASRTVDEEPQLPLCDDTRKRRASND